VLSGAPQLKQKRESSAFSVPHAPHTLTVSSSSRYSRALGGWVWGESSQPSVDFRLVGRQGLRPGMKRAGCEPALFTAMELILEVVVEVELPRMWTQAQLVDLVYSLVVDPRMNHVFGENSPFEQEVVVGLERI
jgi:hypothetical protein